MKLRSLILTLAGGALLVVTSFRCTEKPINSDLSHLALSIDTLTIKGISAIPYSVAPNIGTNDKLYLGSKNELEIPVAFIGITDHYRWNDYYDSTVTFDSVKFILYSNDSLLNQSSTPNLYFNPDSQFHELNSNNLNYEFIPSDWIDLGQPTVHINRDSSSIFTGTELIWNIMSLIETLTDSSDSNLVRTFAIQLSNSDTTFIELFSRDATTGEKDPKIQLRLLESFDISEDSIYVDTVNVNIYSFGDVSIIDPGVIALDDTTIIKISNGSGQRSIITIPFNSTTLKDGALIRNATLLIPVDTTNSTDGFKLTLDPINEISDTNYVENETDPYTGIGNPYKITKEINDGFYKIELKNILQNITLGNEINIGFKIVSDKNNNPFESVIFELENDSTSAVLTILYVVN